MQEVLDGLRRAILLLADVLGWMLTLLMSVLVLLLSLLFEIGIVALQWLEETVLMLLAALEYVTAGTWFGWYVFELPPVIPIVTLFFIPSILLFVSSILGAILSVFKREEVETKFYRIEDDGTVMGIYLDEDGLDEEADEDGCVYRGDNVYKAMQTRVRRSTPKGHNKIPTAVKAAGAGVSFYGGYKLGARIANWLTK